MKRFVYEIFLVNEDYHEINYWNADNYREAKKEILGTYADDEDVIITMIAEIKYERNDNYGFH